MAAAYPVERGASDGHAGKGPALSEAGQGDARRPDLEQQGDGHEEEGRSIVGFCGLGKTALADGFAPPSRTRGRCWRTWSGNLAPPTPQYILHTVEAQDIKLPFECRHGCCTSCVVRIKSGQIRQPEALGISAELREKGYGCYVLATHPPMLKLRFKMKMRRAHLLSYIVN
ncbi:uncharacterized protein LOC100834625 [Brachypodium distachyon]|uniref:uncharacterized protein LOC100834625 n=1 Tax=Brachypodium distachyon TaxID=15368 RepID=UPI000D0DEE21|nr:uncharacterized protein LOC100834625 [Brachypodium distachyon]|eukprot:XP_024317214.1 uncharacterized protein LOC100834625 [Brachypodium distachyon]